MVNKVKILKDIINSSHKIVFFTGAGISTPSGIPDFRSSNGLFKQNLRAEEIIEHSFFFSHTSDFYDYYFKHLVYLDAKPNIAHKYIANLEKEKEVIVVTQNIDNLHQMANSQNVLELHGSIYRNYCLKCHQFYDIFDISQDNYHCCNCSGLIKPDVVLYGEGLDYDVINQSVNAIRNADCLIIVGTSLSVYPAASFINYYNGNKLVVINRDQTNADSQANLVINDDLEMVFMELSND